jgi:phage shock protein C
MTKSGRKQLKRIPSEGRIAGVCAGVAEFLGMETWLVRILWFSGFIFSGGFFFIAYVAAWFILDKEGPDSRKESALHKTMSDQWHRFGSKDIDEAVEVKSKIWQAGEPPKMAYRDILRQYEGIENRIINMESYVTSNQFTLKREIDRL